MRTSNSHTRSRHLLLKSTPPPLSPRRGFLPWSVGIPGVGARVGGKSLGARIQEVVDTLGEGVVAGFLVENTMHLLGKAKEFFFGETHTKFHTHEVFDFEDTEVGLGDVEDTREDGVVVAEVIIVFGGNHNTNNIQLFDGLVVDKPFGGALFHAEKIDERNTQTFDSAGGILDDVLNGTMERSFITLATTVEDGRLLGGLDGANFSEKNTTDLLDEDIQSAVGVGLQIHYVVVEE